MMQYGEKFISSQIIAPLGDKGLIVCWNIL